MWGYYCYLQFHVYSPYLYMKMHNNMISAIVQHVYYVGDILSSL